MRANYENWMNQGNPSDRQLKGEERNEYIRDFQNEVNDLIEDFEFDNEISNRSFNMSLDILYEKYLAYGLDEYEISHIKEDNEKGENK